MYSDHQRNVEVGIENSYNSKISLDDKNEDDHKKILDVLNVDKVDNIGLSHKISSSSQSDDDIKDRIRRNSSSFGAISPTKTTIDESFYQKSPDRKTSYHHKTTKTSFKSRFNSSQVTVVNDEIISVSEYCFTHGDNCSNLLDAAVIF